MVSRIEDEKVGGEDRFQNGQENDVLPHWPRSTANHRLATSFLHYPRQLPLLDRPQGCYARSVPLSLLLTHGVTVGMVTIIVSRKTQAVPPNTAVEVYLPRALAFY